MERYSRDIEGRLEHLVVEVIVSTTLTDVGAHTDGVEDEVNLAEALHSFLEDDFEFFFLRSVSGDDLSIELLAQLIQLPHTNSYSRVGKDDFCAFFYSTFCDAPSDGLFVESTEDDPLLSC